MSVISMFTQYTPLLTIVCILAVIQVLWPIPKLAWKILSVAPGLLVLTGSMIQALVTINAGKDMVISGISLLIIIAFAIQVATAWFLIKNK